MEALRKAFLIVIVSFAVATIDATPTNDDYCSPFTLGLLSTPEPPALVEAGATNVGATAQVDEPGPYGITSVWYTFELSGVTCIDVIADNVNIDWRFALFEFDTSGTCSAAKFTFVAADDDGGPGLWPLLEDVPVSDGTYALQVDGFAGQVGTGDIIIQQCVQLANDDYCYPTDEGTLAVGSELAFPTTNVGATAQPGEPVPPGTGCNTQDGWCGFETSVQNSVWHQFDIDGPECVDVVWDVLEGGTPDLQFALYEVDGLCTPGNFILIAANDDDGPNFVPQIEGAPVDSGKTYVLQVDGFGGVEATGVIKVQDCDPDIDDDGVLNEVDLCPNSDIDEDFDINGCVTNISPQVAGGVFSNGCTPLQELARQCFQNFKNPADNTAPGKVHACTAQILKGWVADGIIQANEIGKIMRCLKNVCTTTCAAN